MDKYNLVCDYLQEAVNLGTMSEEDAAVLEAAAAERYGIEGEIAEESVEDNVEMVTVESSYFESVIDELISAYEAADTTETASLKAYVAAYKELAGTYKNNILSAKKSIKAGNYKEAKNQLNDGKKALAKLKVTTIAYKDSIPGSVASTLCHLIYLESAYNYIVAALTGVTIAAKSATSKDLSKKEKVVGVAIGSGIAAASAGATAMLLKNNKKMKDAVNGSKDLGKQDILVKIQNAEKIIAKIEKLIDKKEAKASK